MTRPLCIYHGHCADGFGAAWVVRRAFGAAGVDLVAWHYRRDPPEVTGRDVVCVDFSFPRAVLLDLATRARSILILDHHASAQRDLVDLPENVRAVFDMGRSGARLAWDWYFHGEAPPALLLAIEDRDLWRFALPLTRELSAAVFSYPYDMAVWDGLMGSNAAQLEALAREGAALERKHRKDVAELLQGARPLVIGGHRVPALNVPYMLAADAGHALAQGEAFAACYSDGPHGRRFSLRSAEDGLDVSEIAAGYGGGGHPRASGFGVPWGHALAPLEGEA